MGITVKPFGKLLKGEKVSCYCMDNNNGLKAEILDYGCIIKNLYTQDKNGNFVDVVLGRDTLAEYADNEGYFGAVIGRNANRIAKAKIKIGRRSFALNKNDGNNNLHGGLKGFDKKLWNVKILDDPYEPALLMTLKSPDGEEGFPGDLDIMVTYTLTKDNGFNIHYTAVAGKDTVVNLTNHSYFNLNGHNSGKNIYNLKLQINSNFFTPNNSECMPDGEILSVSGTPFDFTHPKLLGKDINDTSCEQIKMFGGYDHNFILNGTGVRKAASLYCEENGINMDLYTDKPGMQLYTGNSIEEGRICKEGAVYSKHSALCLETQFFPNAFMYPHFPSTILKKGDKYDYVTEYRFSIK